MLIIYFGKYCLITICGLSTAMLVYDVFLYLDLRCIQCIASLIMCPVNVSNAALLCSTFTSYAEETVNFRSLVMVVVHTSIALCIHRLSVMRIWLCMCFHFGCGKLH